MFLWDWSWSSSWSTTWSPGSNADVTPRSGADVELTLLTLTSHLIVSIVSVVFLHRKTLLFYTKVRKQTGKTQETLNWVVDVSSEGFRKLLHSWSYRRCWRLSRNNKDTSGIQGFLLYTAPSLYCCKPGSPKLGKERVEQMWILVVTRPKKVQERDFFFFAKFHWKSYSKVIEQIFFSISTQTVKVFMYVL